MSSATPQRSTGLRIHNPKRCAGNCALFRSAGTLSVAGQTPLKFLFKESGGVELVECHCMDKVRDAEERGVAGLLHEDLTTAAESRGGSVKMIEEEFHEKPAAAFGEVDTWKVVTELVKLAFGIFLSRASWVIIKV